MTARIFSAVYEDWELNFVGCLEYVGKRLGCLETAKFEYYVLRCVGFQTTE